jgi:hypothetical protein
MIFDTMTPEELAEWEEYILVNGSSILWSRCG